MAIKRLFLLAFCISAVAAYTCRDCPTCPACPAYTCEEEKPEPFDPDALIITVGIMITVMAVVWLYRASVVLSWPFNPRELRPACPPGYGPCRTCNGTSWEPLDNRRNDQLKTITT